MERDITVWNCAGALVRASRFLLSSQVPQPLPTPQLRLPVQPFQARGTFGMPLWYACSEAGLGRGAGGGGGVQKINLLCLRNTATPVNGMSHREPLQKKCLKHSNKKKMHAMTTQSNVYYTK